MASRYFRQLVVFLVLHGCLIGCNDQNLLHQDVRGHCIAAAPCEQHIDEIAGRNQARRTGDGVDGDGDGAHAFAHLGRHPDRLAETGHFCLEDQFARINRPGDIPVGWDYGRRHDGPVAQLDRAAPS